MLTILRLVAKNVKKFAVFNLSFILLIITFCIFFTLNCFADETEPTASATELTSQTSENSTESITEVSSSFATELITEETSDSITEQNIKDNISEKDLLLLIFVAVLILIVICIVQIIL